MTSIYLIFDLLPIFFFYMFLYNITLFLFFLIILQINSSRENTLITIFDLKIFSDYLLFIFFLIGIFFSMGGIPPFLGFFSKMLLLVFMLESNFFFWFLFFFPFLLFSLYFYIRNIRFILGRGPLNFFFLLNNNPLLPSHFILFIFILFFGFPLLDDIFLFCQWFFF